MILSTDHEDNKILILYEKEKLKMKLNSNLIGPLSLEQLRNMNGEPAYSPDCEAWGIISVENLGRWENRPFLRGRWEQANFEYDIEARDLKIYTYPSKNLKSHWVWYEDWTPSTPDGPAECQDAGWYCSNCKWSPNQELGIEFDTPEDAPKFNFCPNCGLPIKDEIKILNNQKESFLYLDIE